MTPLKYFFVFFWLKQHMLKFINTNSYDRVRKKIVFLRSKTKKYYELKLCF